MHVRIGKNIVSPAEGRFVRVICACGCDVLAVAEADSESFAQLEDAARSAGSIHLDVCPSEQKDPVAGLRSVRQRHILEDLFSYHAPTPDDIPHYEAIRAAAKVFGAELLANTPGCPDQSAALRLLRQCVMTANASIALKGKY